MSLYTIKQHHRSSVMFPSLWFGKDRFSWMLSFQDSYTTSSADRLHWNTAAGITVNCLSTSDYIMLGWRYEEKEKGFALSVLSSTMRGSKEMCPSPMMYQYHIRPGRTVLFSIQYIKDTKSYTVILKGNGYHKHTYTIEHMSAPVYGKSFYPYFNRYGNTTAPNDIKVIQKQLI